jgi:hypothetical protein
MKVVAICLTVVARTAVLTAARKFSHAVHYWVPVLEAYVLTVSCAISWLAEDVHTYMHSSRGEQGWPVSLAGVMPQAAF